MYDRKAKGVSVTNSTENQLKTDENSTSKELLGRVWGDYLKRHVWWLLVAFFFMAIEGGALGVLSYMLEPMFNRVFVGGDYNAIWWVGGVIFALFVLRAISNLVQKTIMTMVAQRTSTDMQKDLLAHLMTLDSQFFQKNSPGALMERLQGDTAAVQGVWNVIISGVGRDLTSLAALMFVALRIDWVWTATAVIGVPLLILPVVALQRYIRRKTEAMRQQAGLRSTQLDEVFHGINPIKLNLMEAYQQARFNATINRIVSAEVRTAAGRAMIPSLIDIITGIGFFGVLIVGGHDIIAGEKNVGQFMSFFSALGLAFQPLRRLGAITGIWQVAATSLARLYAAFDEKPTIMSPADPADVRDAGGADIELRDVQMAYGEAAVLRGTSFVAKAGETTALVGASGAGKSTVFNMLTRLVEPQSGAVTLGGVPVDALHLDRLRRVFSVVTQDTMLFDETLRDNILMGRSDVDDAELTAAVKAAHVDDFVSQMPAGLESPAGPRGGNLSGGQRQRVAIARALLRDSPVLLLDEATSALDARSEKLVQEALERLSKGRTTLVIAHRLSTVRNADKIVVMDHGRVVEEGNHDRLMALNGAYAQLYHLQFDRPDEAETTG